MEWPHSTRSKVLFDWYLTALMPSYLQITHVTVHYSIVQWIQASTKTKSTFLISFDFNQANLCFHFFMFFFLQGYGHLHGYHQHLHQNCHHSFWRRRKTEVKHIPKEEHFIMTLIFMVFVCFPSVYKVRGIAFLCDVCWITHHRTQNS